MSTSGSADFTRTRNQIITEAYQLLNVYGADEALTDPDLAFGNSRLNSMIKAWQAMGINLWTYEEAVIFLSSLPTYTLGTNGDKSCLLSDFVETTLSGDEAASQTVLSVTSSTGMTALDIIGIVLDDNTIHWTTVVSVDSATQVTVTSGLASVAASGNQVFTYTSTLYRPLKIHSIRRHGSNGIETPLYPISRQEYFDLSNKTNSGVPNEFYYDPKLNAGKLYIYQAPSDVTTYLRATISRSFEDFDDADNTPDFPQEWLDAIIYNLALRMAPAFGKMQEAVSLYAPLATALLDAIKGYDTETTSLFITGSEY